MNMTEKITVFNDDIIATMRKIQEHMYKLTAEIETLGDLMEDKIHPRKRESRCKTCR